MTPLRKSVPSYDGIVGGRVMLRDASSFSIALERGQGEVIARRAASCLLQPEPSDRVLVALAPEPFVLAVLERGSDRRAELAVDGAAVLRVSGTLELDAEQG